jgi:hypothetical protein
MTLNRSIENINFTHYSPALITILLPSSFLCLAFLLTVIIYIYLRKSRQNLNEDEKHRHMNILKQYVNHLKEINEKQPDTAVIPSYLCRLHQNSQTNLNAQPKKLRSIFTHLNQQ